MNKRKAAAKRQPFLLHRPEIVITPSRAKPFSVDCRELPSWACIPEVGKRTLLAFYNPPAWKLTNVMEVDAVRPARIHDTDGVEMEVNDWEPQKGWTRGSWMVYARLTEKTVQWLATYRVVNDRRILYTFLDEGFEADYGEAPRTLKDSGRMIRQEGGFYKLKKPAKEVVHDIFGAGIFRVKIGARAFTCLRILDIESKPSEKGILYISYITRKGRTVLGRRYNGRQWALHRGSEYAGLPWDERFPKNDRLVIDGVTFVHWYDVLSHLAFAITTPRAERK
jgi:hypothetical protein